MIEYLVKSTLSLLLLYSTYEILLGRLKIFRLKRYILLLSVIVSLLLPLVSITFDVSSGRQIPDASGIIGIITTATGVSNPNDAVTKPEITNSSSFASLQNIVLVIYLLISVILLFRFLKNIVAIISISKKCDKVKYRENEIFLCNADIAPFSFFNSIFISKKNYENSSIDNSLINHEIAHIKNLHSIDIIFIEFVSIFFWFNPLIYLYKKAIRLNHEYMADSFAVENETSISDYSHKLIDISSRGKYLYLTSGLNYSFIKKRINMLVNQNNKRFLKTRLTVFGLITTGLFIFTACVFNPGNNNNRTPDRINTLWGTSSGYRINDSTYYFYGDFSITSGSLKTKITAHRLKLSIELSESKNYFENDFMSGRVYTDGVDIYTNRMFLDKIISYKADNIKGSENSKLIKLKGNAELKGEDVKIQSDEITLYLSEWRRPD